jgi:glycosyltransferase involved in cell wall biosynthesis
MYDQIARRMRFVHRPPGEGPQRSSLRVAMVVPNLIDYVVAYTKRVLHFADRLDPERYELSVYVSENLTARESPLFPFGCRNGSSKDTGARTIEVLQKQRIPLYLGSNTTGFTQTAGTIAGQLVRDRIDIAIFQSGLACPIDWLAARIADIPVKLSIHTGCSLFLPGMDATFMDSPDDMEREADVWTSVHGNRILMHKGTDLKELRRYEAYRRSEFGIPPDAVVIGTMSNHLDARLSSPYMTVLADILKSHSDAWLLFFGAAELPEQMDFFRTQGVGNRVKFGGKQSRSAPALKVLDIYANEFPVGGSQSVMEAIGCGLPVAAMKWSQAHAESVGAEIVGPEYAVPSRDPAAYARLIENWIVNPQQRHEAARKMLARAEQSFSVDSYVQRIMRHAEDIFRRKQR